MNFKQAYENHLEDKKAKWFAVYTHFKREKMVLKYLQRKDICAYLPTQKKIRKYTRKVRIVELPLISCYIFVKITKREYLKVLETEHVLNFVKFSKNLISIPEEEMELMKWVLGEGLEVNINKTNFCEGDKVEIISGNLTGLKGVLLKTQNKNQVLVDLRFIGYTLEITVDARLLRKTNKLVSLDYT